MMSSSYFFHMRRGMEIPGNILESPYDVFFFSNLLQIIYCENDFKEISEISI